MPGDSRIVEFSVSMPDAARIMHLVIFLCFFDTTRTTQQNYQKPIFSRFDVVILPEKKLHYFFLQHFRR